MSTERPSRIDALTAWFGVIGALLALFSGVYQLWQGNLHSARELRWKQAETAREMIGTMVADEGWKGMEMLDWTDEGRAYEFEGRTIHLNAQAVYEALSKPTSNDRDRYIIDHFDRALFLVSQLEVAVRSELVRAEDVRFPVSWYAANRLCPRKALFEDYMKDNAAPETLQFFRRLEEWHRCPR